MKKRIIIVLLSAVMAVSAAACGNGKKDGTGSGKDSEQSGGESGSEKDGGASDAESYDLDETVKLGEYKGLKVSMPNTYKVTKAQIEEYANSMAEYYAKPSYKDTNKKTVEDGDIVNIDYEGKKDGVAFKGGTAADQYLTIGSGRFIDGFEDGLIGKKVGETVDLDLKFPDNYQNNEELSGAAVVFTVTINKIVEVDESKEFELTDDFVKENFDYENVKEYKANIKEYLQSLNQDSKTTDTREAIVGELQKICEVTIPEDLLKKRVEDYIAIFERKNISGDDVTLESFLKDNYNGMTEEDFRTQITSEMESSLKSELILEAIAKKESIELDENEFKEYVQQQMSANGYEAEEQFYELNGTDAESGEQYTRKIFVGRKALDLVVDNAEVKYGVTEENETEENNKTEDNETENNETKE